MPSINVHEHVEKSRRIIPLHLPASGRYRDRDNLPEVLELVPTLRRRRRCSPPPLLFQRKKKNPKKNRELGRLLLLPRGTDGDSSLVLQ